MGVCQEALRMRARNLTHEQRPTLACSGRGVGWAALGVKMELINRILEAVFWFFIIGIPANFFRYLSKNPDEKKKLLEILMRRAGSARR